MRRIAAGLAAGLAAIAAASAALAEGGVYLQAPNGQLGVVPSATASAATSLVVSSAPAFLEAFHVTTGAVPGYVLILNATSDPGSGAVTPVECYQVAANSTLAVSEEPLPPWLKTGVVIVFSSTGCFTETQSSTAFISAKVAQ